MSEFQLSSEQLEQFHRDGFLMIRGLFDQQEATALHQSVLSDERLAADTYGRKDAGGAETRLALRNDLDDSTPYTAVVRSQRVAGTAARLLDDEVYHFHHKVMQKEPRTGGAWEWHQDYGYWYNFGCLYPHLVSCLIAITAANKENGCLQILPGSHHIGRIDHIRVEGQVVADPERVKEAEKRMELSYCEMAPGDGLFFHSNLLHRSDRNGSDDPRWSLICCYNTKTNDPYVTDGRHPNYSKLEQWTDERARDAILSHCIES